LYDVLFSLLTTYRSIVEDDGFIQALYRLSLID